MAGYGGGGGGGKGSYYPPKGRGGGKDKGTQGKTSKGADYGATDATNVKKKRGVKMKSYPTMLSD